jgi:myosin-5
VDDCQDFDDLRVAMDRVGIDAGAQFSVFAAVAAVLWLGNIAFIKDNSDAVVIKPGKALGNAARLLQVGGWAGAGGGKGRGGQRRE